MLGDVNNYIINSALWNYTTDMLQKVWPSLPPPHIEVSAPKRE